MKIKGTAIIVAPTDFGSFPFGGTLTYLQEFLGGLSSDETHIVKLVGLGPKGSLGRLMSLKIGERAFDYLPVASIGRGILPIRVRFVAGLLRASREIAALKGAVFYVHNAESVLAVRAVAGRVPIVFHVHGTENTIRRSRFRYGRWWVTRAIYHHCITRTALRLASRVLVTADSEDFETFVGRNMHSGARKAIKVPGMIDVGLFRPRTLSEPKEAGELALVSVGRLEPLKGMDIVIRATSRLTKRGVRVRLVIIGDGSQRAGLEELAKQVGLQDRIMFTGYLKRARVAEELRNADVYVSASSQEGFSLALLEALASGLPAIVSDVGGVREVIENGRTGYIVSVRHDEGFAKEIERSWGHARSMSRDCRAVAEMYSSEIVGGCIWRELSSCAGTTVESGGL